MFLQELELTLLEQGKVYCPTMAGACEPFEKYAKDFDRLIGDRDLMPVPERADDAFRNIATALGSNDPDEVRRLDLGAST